MDKDVTVLPAAGRGLGWPGSLWAAATPGANISAATAVSRPRIVLFTGAPSPPHFLSSWCDARRSDSCLSPRPQIAMRKAVTAGQSVLHLTIEYNRHMNFFIADAGLGFGRWKKPRLPSLGLLETPRTAMVKASPGLTGKGGDCVLPGVTKRLCAARTVGGAVDLFRRPYGRWRPKLTALPRRRGATAIST